MTGARPRVARRRTLATGLFVLYLVMLVWFVLWKFESPWVGDGALREISLVPFASDSGFELRSLLEPTVNVICFVPLGVYLGVLAPAWHRWQAFAAILATSLVLETAQFVLALGVSDVTDLITNTIGGLLGVLLVARARRRFGTDADRMLMRACVVISIVGVLAAAAFVASPLHYGPQQHRAEALIGGIR